MKQKRFIKSMIAALVISGVTQVAFSDPQIGKKLDTPVINFEAAKQFQKQRGSAHKLPQPELNLFANCDIRLKWQPVLQGRVQIGQRFRIGVEFINEGSGPCPPFKVSLLRTRTVDGASSGYNDVGGETHRIPGLSPGRSQITAWLNTVERLSEVYRFKIRYKPTPIDGNYRNHNSTFNVRVYP